ncbi:IclR family transcriptional regulator [Deferribacterales bacterium RsTz2092]|nr:IclR family transcriptional regulator [Deferribacterales bacterium]
MRANAKIQSVQSVSHALMLLEVFRKTDGSELGVTELSKLLGLHKNKIFRLLATLCDKGYIEQNTKTENYMLGAKVFDLGQKFINRLGLLSLAHPFMQKVVELVDESVYIGILREDRVIYLGLEETSKSVRVASRAGRDVPAHPTAVGKLLLSFSTEEEFSRLYQTEELEQYTPNTISTVTELRKKLAEIRTQGYAFDEEEYELGVSCIGTAIKDCSNLPVAVLGVTAPSSRMSHKKMTDEILPVLQKFAGEISKRLGYDG